MVWFSPSPRRRCRASRLAANDVNARHCNPSANEPIFLHIDELTRESLCLLAAFAHRIDDLLFGVWVRETGLFHGNFATSLWTKQQKAAIFSAEVDALNP